VNRHLIRAVIEEIGKATHDNIPVIVVEYEGYGPTHWMIHEALNCYQPYRMVVKHRCDGSKELEPYVADLDTVHLCGVNTTVCVHETAVGLVELFPELDVGCL
jgi:nicotinamidase-related amidase